MKKLLSLVLAVMLCLSAVSVSAQETSNVQHYLLLGFDYWGDETIGTSFSDTNIILSVDAENSRILVASMMRDSYVEMPSGKMSKLNQVVRKEGFDAIVETVENTLDIDITAYIAISAPGFARLIGELGGVEVDISKSEYESLKKRGMTANIPGYGKQTLRGNGLYAYLKDRYMGGGDMARTDKAREVMEQLIAEAKAMNRMELLAFAQKAMEEVKMNLGLMEIISLATAALSMDGMKLETMALPPEGTYKTRMEKSNSIVDADWEAVREKYHAFIAGN